MVQVLDPAEETLPYEGRTEFLSPGGEERWVSIGELDEAMVAVVWTRRRDATRIITMRRARDEEKRRYRAVYG